MEILDHMEEHFRRLGAQKSDEECRKKLICKLAEKGNKNQDENAKKLLKYASEMRYVPEASVTEFFFFF